MSDKILIVEDDITLRETLTYNLNRHGYETITTGNGNYALLLAQQHQPHLILLDIMLPGIDGLELCRRLRQQTSVPILMLTARTDEIDKIVGLEMGADDYITKPFSIRELLARIKAQLRRVRLTRQEANAETKDEPALNATRLVFNNLIIDENRREALLNGQPLYLKPKEYELLLFLARQRGLALSRDLILERVWGWSYDGGSRTVDVHIRWLREKIEYDSTNPERIVTVRSVGYRFEG